MLLLMKFIGRNIIKLEKEINELDKFVLRFVKILEKHADYVIVSGYISILFGRTRTTEDIDIFIEELSKEKFTVLYGDFKKYGYWCLNAENIDEVYSYLKDGFAVRFALENKTIPNFEIKFAKDVSKKSALKDTLTVETKLGNIKISSLERQIAYKRYYLKSDKDLEDAAHIEKLFKDDIDASKVEQYKRYIGDEMAKTWKR